MPTEVLRAEELISKGKIKEALNITTKFEGTAWTYFFAGDYEKGLEIGFQCKELYEKIGNKSRIANNLILLGNFHLQIGERNEGLNYATKSLELNKQINDRNIIFFFKINSKSPEV